MDLIGRQIRGHVCMHVIVWMIAEEFEKVEDDEEEEDKGNERRRRIAPRVN